MIRFYFILFVVAVSAEKWITTTEKPGECGPNAFWNTCANPCKQRSCDDRNPSKRPTFCPAVCVRQCSCNPGYVKGPNGSCILERDCPPINNCTGPNEFWNECGSNCEKRCQQPADGIACAAVCVPKCSCISGHVRGLDGNCIPEKDCPPKQCLGQNEFWNTCGSDCERQCEEPEEPMICPAVCVEKCSCIKGHVRGPDGKCIPKDECPRKPICSDPNAVWSECANSCSHHSCGEPEDSGEPKICTAVCEQTCICKEGYVTGPNGNCILKEDCPPKEECGENAFWNECGSGCEADCDESEQTKFCTADCVPKCSCKLGYVKGPDGNCIEKSHCPPKNCSDPNAVWSECASGCDQHSCGESDEPKFCPAVCLRQCTCKPGYVTGPLGNCILKEDCPPKEECGVNEIWNECGSYCEDQCGGSIDPGFCPQVCVPKCSCKPGHVRGPDGICIPEKDCPPKPVCLDPNSVWSECASGCDQHSCGDSDEPKSCTKICLRQCTCKPGYVTGPDGNCILKEDCPPKEECLRDNEFWNPCGSGCEPDCDGSEKTKLCAAVCVPQCSCKRGYVRAPDGNCVLKKDCPPKNQCFGEHEFWNPCGNNCEPDCDGSEKGKACAAVCVPKCSCEHGYVRGPYGNCVVKEDCPRKEECKHENEFWNPCGSNCEPDCEGSERWKRCAAICVPKCSCKRGYVRAPDGNCVQKKHCPPENKCLGENQFWNPCGSGCEPDCDGSEETKSCTADCVPKCSCKRGYVTAPDGNCVKKEDCPPKNNCSDPNAVWNECARPCTQPSCDDDPDKPIECASLICLKQCECKPGFVTGPDGKCILRKDCPPKNQCSDPNEFWTNCGTACEQGCDEPKPGSACPAICISKCVCKEGLVRGPDGKCILKNKCPPKNECSDPNEFWTDCGTACEQGCDEPEPGSACPAICISKCVCKKGLVRGPNGKCIPKTRCPKKCRGRNQFWNECGSACEPRCDKSHLGRVCPAVCMEKCSCKRGYVIAKNGDCVKEEDCYSTCPHY